ncbi:MAG: hypothetical protein CMF51_04350 [Legionellales bacterium]|nr:hypothetical protein [Legionellales bacterium]
MHNLSGSFGQKQSNPQLTPFEQADYNLTKFVLNAQLSSELDAVMKRLAALEKMKSKFQVLLEGITGNVSLAISTRSRLAEIEEEIIATEFLLQAVCETYSQEM